MNSQPLMDTVQVFRESRQMMTNLTHQIFSILPTHIQLISIIYLLKE